MSKVYNPKVNLIGIVGKKNSGKDTVADIIQYLTSPCSDKAGKTYRTFQEYLSNRNRHPSLPDSWYISEWENKKFAYKLKQMASIILGVHIEKFEDREYKESYLDKRWNYITGYDSTKDPVEIISPMTVRDFLCRLGQGIRDRVHPDFWVTGLFSDYYPLDDTKRSSMGNVLDYSDCPYPKWIVSDVRYKNEVKAIEDRGGIVVRVNRDLDNTSRHSSEVELDGYPFKYYIDNNGSLEDLIQRTVSLLEAL